MIIFYSFTSVDFLTIEYTSDKPHSLLTWKNICVSRWTGSRLLQFYHHLDVLPCLKKLLHKFEEGGINQTSKYLSDWFSADNFKRLWPRSHSESWLFLRSRAKLALCPWMNNELMKSGGLLNLRTCCLEALQ